MFFRLFRPHWRRLSYCHVGLDDDRRLACREMHAEMARRGLGPNDYLLEGVAIADGGHEVRAIEPDERVLEFDDRGIV